jgi:serine/threonine protein kinase
MPLNTGSRVGSYEIVALIGAGGMGEVYRARDTRLKRDVAIKVLPDIVFEAVRDGGFPSLRRSVSTRRQAKRAPLRQATPPAD